MEAKNKITIKKISLDGFEKRMENYIDFCINYPETMSFKSDYFSNKLEEFCSHYKTNEEKFYAIFLVSMFDSSTVPFEFIKYVPYKLFTTGNFKKIEEKVEKFFKKTELKSTKDNIDRLWFCIGEDRRYVSCMDMKGRINYGIEIIKEYYEAIQKYGSQEKLFGLGFDKVDYERVFTRLLKIKHFNSRLQATYHLGRVNEIFQDYIMAKRMFLEYSRNGVSLGLTGLIDGAVFLFFGFRVKEITNKSYFYNYLETKNFKKQWNKFVRGTLCKIRNKDDRNDRLIKMDNYLIHLISVQYLTATFDLAQDFLRYDFAGLYGARLCNWNKKWFRNTYHKSLKGD